MKIKRINMDIVAVIIIAVCLLAIGAYEMFSPAKKIERIVYNTIEEYSNLETANSVFINNDTFDILNNDDITVYMGNTSQNGNSIDFTFDRDMGSKEAQSKLVVSKNGEETASVENYFTDEETILVGGDLYGDNLIVDDNIASAIIYYITGISVPRDEVFNTNANSDSYNYINRAFGASGNVSSQVMSELKTVFLSAANASWTKVYKDADISRTNEGYEVKLSPEATKEFFTAFGEKMFSDELMISFLTEIANSSYNYMYMFQGITQEQYVDQYISGMEEAYNQWILDNEPGETTLALNVSKGIMTRFQLSSYVAIGDVQVDLNYVAEFTGQENPMDQFNSYFAFTSSDGGEIRVSYAQTNTNENGVMTTNKTYTTDTAMDQISTSVTTINTTYNTNTNDFSVDYTETTDDAQGYSVSADGSVINDGGYIDIDSEIAFNIPDYGTVPMGNVYFRVVALENEITAPEGDILDTINTKEAVEAEEATDEEAATDEVEATEEETATEETTEAVEETEDSEEASDLLTEEDVEEIFVTLDENLNSIISEFAQQ